MKRILWIALLCITPVNALASDITLNLSVNGNAQNLTLNGKTNLPPKTLLAATLVSPIDQGGDGFTASAKAAVSANQAIQFGPFSKIGGRLSPGVYKVTVATALAAFQPQEVQPFFGAHGGSLTGSQVLTLDGTSERIFWQTLQFKINPDGSIGSFPSNPPSNPRADQSTIGSAGEKWQKVQSNGEEIYIMTNADFLSGLPEPGHGFHTRVVVNLPESDIVDAPQSAEYEVQGNCETKHYNNISSVFFAGKNRSGTPSEVEIEPEVVERKLIPGSPFEKAFDLLCKIAGGQK